MRASGEQTYNRVVPIVLGVVVLALAAVWLSMNLEKKSIRFYVGAKAEARRNPLLAAERLLEHYGARIESGNSSKLLRNPPGQSGLILVHGPSATLGNADQIRLRAWIEHGGHLIYDAGALWDSKTKTLRSTFLNDFGISAIKHDHTRHKVRVEVQGDEPLQVYMRPRMLLRDERHAADLVLPHENDDTYFGLSIPVGVGRLTALVDTGFMVNGDIGKLDHAALLLMLVDGEKRIWVLRDHEVPGLLGRLWRWAPQLIVCVLLVLLFELWRRGFRIGPLQPLGERGNRDLSAHFRAHAGYLWRHQMAGRLLTQRRQRLWQHFERHHPVLREMNLEQRLDWLSERSGIARTTLAAVMSPVDAGQGEQGFLSSSQIMQRLWRIA